MIECESKAHRRHNVACIKSTNNYSAGRTDKLLAQEISFEPRSEISSTEKNRGSLVTPCRMMADRAGATYRLRKY
jgi:hypothetical protein